MDGTQTTEFADPPAGARIFTEPMRPSLGDCAPAGRIRLDGLARWLQDVAYADVEDAGLAAHAYWVLRRTRIVVSRWPQFAEWFTVRTFCTGLGRMWAERRTTICPQSDGAPPAAPVVEAAAIWVHLDAASRRPMPFTPEEIEAYGAAAAIRRVSAKLRHPTPPPEVARSTWSFRAAECDIAGHINNAAYWAPVEEELLRTPESVSSPLAAEMEFRAGAQPGEKLVLAEGAMRWITDLRGEVHASVRLESGAGSNRPDWDR